MAKNKQITLLILTVALALGAWLRLYKLSAVPSAVYVDEAAVGYNAYSLWQTGADEYGKPFPVFMRFFGAFSSPLYTFLTILPVSLLGLSALSVRLVSVISGIFVILFTYLIISVFRWKNKQVPALVALLCAISPWGVFLSRMGTEGHLALGFYMASVWAWLKARSNPKFWLVVFVCLALASWSYNAARAVSLIFLALVFFFELTQKNNSIRNKYFWGGVIFWILLLLPQASVLSTPAFTHRGTSLLYQADDVVREFLSQFAAYFSPANLFFNPDPDRQRSIPEISVFYSWMFGLFLFGVSGLRKLPRQIKAVLFILALSGVIVPALTRDPFSSVRGQFLIPFFVLLFAVGLDKVLVYRRLSMSLLALLLPLSLLSLWRGYFVLLPYERAKDWGYGYQELAAEIETREGSWIIDQSRQHAVYPQLLFHLKFPPSEFQQSLNPSLKDNYYTDLNFSLDRMFGNIQIRTIAWQTDIYQETYLVGDRFSISSDQANEHKLELIKQINAPNGEVLFVIFKTNPTAKCLYGDGSSELCSRVVQPTK